MSVPSISENFGDLLDPRFQEIFDREAQFEEAKSMLAEFFTFPEDNGRADMRWSETGAMGDWSQFTGSVNYDDMNQGFDVTASHVEFASGFQVERKLFDDDQYNIMDQRPAELGTSAVRTREKHGARVLNNAFSVDNFFYTHSEGTALCANAHTTTAAGVSTATGFDNLTTDALSATALTSAVTQMRYFRDDRANRINIMPDELWIPIDLFDVAFEIVSSMGKVDTAENNRNVHEGAYDIKQWIYLTDSNNWFLCDSTMRRRNVMWIDRVAREFAFAEDLDTLIAKWRGYMRYSNARINWRWILGGQVS